MIRFASSLMARCSSKDRPKLPTEKERSKLQTEKERPQAPAFQEHSFKSVPNEWEQSETLCEGGRTWPSSFYSWTLVRAVRHARHRKPPAQRVEANFRYATKTFPLA
ncbi:hypothetical protein I050019G5_17710 [Collinsella sp. i05-0019-G5]